MGQKDKLIRKLKSRPKDFSFSDVEALLSYFGYKRFNKGRTSGSRVKFSCDNRAPILLHKPHHGNNLLDYQIKQLIENLSEEGFL